MVGDLKSMLRVFGISEGRTKAMLRTYGERIAEG